MRLSWITLEEDGEELSTPPAAKVPVRLGHAHELQSENEGHASGEGDDSAASSEGEAE